MSVLISKVAVGLPNRKLSQIVSLMKHTNIIKYGLKSKNIVATEYDTKYSERYTSNF